MKSHTVGHCCRLPSIIVGHNIWPELNGSICFRSLFFFVKITILSVFISFVLVVSLALSQELSLDSHKYPMFGDEVEQLDLVTVTAKEGKPTWFEVSSAKNKIEKEMIKQRVPDTLPGVLRGEPGVFIQETTPGQGTPILRGLLGSSTVMTVDGMRLNNAIFRSAPNQYFALVDPYNVDHIELFRGAQSTLFGDGAIGGVVSVSTPIPQFDTTAWTWKGNFQGAFRSADLSRMTRLGLAGGFEGLGVSGGFTYQGHDDLRGGGDVGRQRPSDYESFAGDGKIFLGDEFQNFLLNIQFLEQPKTPRYDQLVPGFGQTNPSSSEFVFEPNNRLFIHGRYLHNLSVFFLDRIEVNLSFQEINDDRRIQEFGRSEVDQEENRDRLLEFNVNGLSHWKDYAMFRYGVQILRDEVRSRRQRQNLITGTTNSVPSRFANHSSVTSGAGYLQSIISLSSLWEVSLGGRWSYVDINVPKADRSVGTHLSISELTGDVGVVFHLTHSINLVSNFGRSVRTPNVFDLSTLGPRPGNRFNIPNSNLGAEKAWSIDGGLKWQTPDLIGELIGFLIRIDDKIESVPTGQTTTNGEVVVQNVNLNEVTLTGLETGFLWRWNLQMEIFGNLTFTRGEETVGKGQSNPADRIPPLQGRLGGAYQFTPQFRVESFVRFADRQDRLSPRDLSDSRINPDGTPGWVTLNFRSSYDFGSGVMARLSLLNVLNQPYREHGSGINASGINAVFSLEVSL